VETSSCPGLDVLSEDGLLVWTAWSFLVTSFPPFPFIVDHVELRIKTTERERERETGGGEERGEEERERGRKEREGERYTDAAGDSGVAEAKNRKSRLTSSSCDGKGLLLNMLQSSWRVDPSRSSNFLLLRTSDTRQSLDNSDRFGHLISRGLLAVVNDEG
jgi:hypothetical protein